MISNTEFKRKRKMNIRAGTFIVAVGLIAFGLEHVIFNEFVTGRVPILTEPFAGKEIWIYISAALVALGGISILSGFKTSYYFLFLALLILALAIAPYFAILLRAEVYYGVELTLFGKALALFGGFLVVAALYFPADNNSNLSNLANTLARAGSFCFALYLVIAGIQHFIFAEFVSSLVPSWVPGNIYWVYLTGIALIAGGVGLVVKRTRYIAGNLVGIMIFIWFLILHLPRAIAADPSKNEWIAVVEALTFSGFSFIIAGRKENKYEGE